METPTQPDDAPILNCEQCCAEIPPEGGLQAEVDDVVFFLCGAECYESWKRQRSADD